MDRLHHKNIKGVSANVLKWIAIISMTIDHLGAGLLELGYMEDGKNLQFFGKIFSLEEIFQLYDYMRKIGRIAFPIFVFLLVEGFFHTKDRKKTLLRLFLFAILSEIPFNLAFNGVAWAPYYQNIFFTLSIGYLAMIFSEKISGNKGILKIIITIVIFGLFGQLADFLSTDYGSNGIYAIGFFYLLHGEELWRRVLSTILAFYFEVGAVYFAVIPIALYNGQKGKQQKYFFYLYYPIHLLCIYLTRIVIFS
ncbi:MAG: TraX family protein [Tissierellia bacterium]|nr:TraX family protein [Tissierellia bacterium]